jgi:hypothetical protein
MSLAGKRNPPKGWYEAYKLSSNLIADLFLVSKTPLSESRYRTHGDESQYTPTDLLSRAEARGHKIGMVIDLTNTHLYYDPSEFEKRGIQYKKIRCDGYNGVPTEEAVEEFHRVCKDHQEQWGWTRIVVHCTYGRNRTGYMIARYLMDYKDYDCDDAISEMRSVVFKGLNKVTYRSSLWYYYRDHILTNRIYGTHFDLFNPKDIRDVQGKTKFVFIQTKNKGTRRVDLFDKKSKILLEKDTDEDCHLRLYGQELRDYLNKCEATLRVIKEEEHIILNGLRSKVPHKDVTLETLSSKEWAVRKSMSDVMGLGRRSYETGPLIFESCGCEFCNEGPDCTFYPLLEELSLD